MPGKDAKLREFSLSSFAIVAALLVGGFLTIDSALLSSATYDEVAYLEIAAKWWREGTQERIARMGSPLTFWKIQHAPVFWCLDRLDRGHLIDDPIPSQAVLLPLVRVGSIWIWGIGLLLTALWARREHGLRAMAAASWLYALSPNLIAHGGLATMELPLVAATAGIGMLFSRYLATGSRRAYVGAAVLAGLAFSLKFTAITLLPWLGIAWWWERVRQVPHDWYRSGLRACLVMSGFLVLMVLANLAVTGGACIPLSEHQGDHPILSQHIPDEYVVKIAPLLEFSVPQDWAAFARQVQHQRTGGPSYLFGARRSNGWWYYYLVCLAVKVPLSIWMLMICRAWFGRAEKSTAGDRITYVVIAGTMILVALGSTRNYGYRYILFLAPFAIVWISSLAERGAWPRRFFLAGLIGQVVAVASVHPHELSYFNLLAGGPEGGKWVLADSNLDWGQGARALARLQAENPEYRDLTFFAFGDTDPTHYGVVGACFLIDAHGPRETLPRLVSVETAYLAVSRSLQHGPWGSGWYFNSLNRIRPTAITDDHTIAIYRVSEIRALPASTRDSGGD